MKVATEKKYDEQCTGRVTMEEKNNRDFGYLEAGDRCLF